MPPRRRKQRATRSPAERTPMTSTRAPQGLTHRAMGGMFWTFSGTGVQVGVQLVTIMALGRLLTPTEFGLMGAASVIIGFSQIVSQVGVGPAIIQRQELEPVHIRVAVTLSLALGLLLGAAVYLGAPQLAAFYRIPEVEPVLRGIAILFALDAGSYILGYACVGVLLAWMGFGVWSLVAANIVQSVLRVTGMYAATRHPLRPSADLGAGRSLLSFGFGHSMAQIGTLFSQQGDNLVVGRWLGPAALGIYGRAYNLMVMPASAFGRIVNRVLFPIMAQVQDQRHRLANAYERGLAIVAFLSLPLSVFLWVVAPEFIPVILGPQWTDVVLPFRLFTISLLFRMASKISDACIKAAGVVYSWAALQFAYAGLVVAGAILGQRWGVGGVAVCVSVAMGLDWLNMAYLSRKVTGLTWGRFLAAHLPAICLAIVLGGGAELGALAGRMARLGPLAVLLIAGAASLVTAVAAGRLWPTLFLGPHGQWAVSHGQALLRRRSAGVRPTDRPEPEISRPT